MGTDINRPISRTLNIEDAGAMLGISRPTSYKLARTDQFPVPVIRVGRRMVVSREAVDALLSRQKDDGGDRAA
ncbi:MAG: helix-turn-helix domain-containing protein [Chloroflexota bacterium]|nr:helix-turn-helix domain-containing protein [Chloroflexota bacterium]